MTKPTRCHKVAIGRTSMPLLDHFHPPLFGRRHWEAFHGWWAAAMAASLNERLPEDYFAEFQVTLGARVEVDVATFTEQAVAESLSSNGGIAVANRVWAPPAPTVVVPASFPDDIEVQIYSSAAGAVLVAA